MSKNFFVAVGSRSQAAFDDAALGLQMGPVILEKDFWVVGCCTAVLRCAQSSEVLLLLLRIPAIMTGDSGRS